MEPACKKRRWPNLTFKTRKMSSASSHSEHHDEDHQVDESPEKEDEEELIFNPNAITITSLPSELQQDILLYVLRACLTDYIDGEKRFRDTVLAFATTSRIMRGNAVTALKMIRMEISHVPAFGYDAEALRRCNHIASMRILVLTLEYNLTTGSKIPIKITRCRDMPADGRDWLGIVEKVQDVRETFVPVQPGGGGEPSVT